MRKITEEKYYLNQIDEAQRALRRGGPIFKEIINKSISDKFATPEDIFILKDTYGIPFKYIILFLESLEIEYNSYHIQVYFDSLPKPKNLLA